SKSLWVRFLFQDRGILPTRRLFIAFFVFSCFIGLLSFFGIPWMVIFLLNMLFIFGSLGDLFFSPRKSELAFKRTLPEEMERGIAYTVKIHVQNTSSHDCDFRIMDDLPSSFHTSFPIHGEVEKQGSLTLTYETKAFVRGKYDVNKLYVRYSSLLGLWEKQITLEIKDTIKVIPDLTETKQFLESAQKFLLYEGQKVRKRRRGEGEFAQIRNYVIGDDPRKINWRQTAKLQEVMTNEYEPEHGKYVTILIDCGRVMGAELTKGNRLEKSLEAAITVALAALKNGDYVSVLAFSRRVDVFVPPAKGMGQLQKILQAVYDLQVDTGEANYPAVMSYLQAVQKKRSFIMLFSDMQTFLHEESGLGYLTRLRRQHHVCMIGIEDASLLALTRQKVDDVKQAMTKSIAQQQMQIKKRKKAEWESRGLIMIEAKEERLANAAVSEYIRIMNQGLV